jgi:hypothetical protein
VHIYFLDGLENVAHHIDMPVGPCCGIASWACCVFEEYAGEIDEGVSLYKKRYSVAADGHDPSFG